MNCVWDHLPDHHRCDIMKYRCHLCTKTARMKHEAIKDMVATCNDAADFVEAITEKLK